MARSTGGMEVAWLALRDEIENMVNDYVYNVGEVAADESVVVYKAHELAVRSFGEQEWILDKIKLDISGLALEYLRSLVEWKYN